VEVPEEIRDKVISIGQEHVLMFWEEIQESEQKILADQIAALNIEQFREQQAIFAGKNFSGTQRAFSPLKHIAKSGHDENIRWGRQLLSQGKAGCLLIAGGQGTRLKFDGPKGMYPISPIKRKTLYQLFAEKTVAAGKQANRVLPLAIMTSPSNHEQTMAHFEENRYFGLNPDQVSFFFASDTSPFG
jgi:UDP-N-acetylglucosamine/UDP-N-acetylgalactosamine diphosphorylase